jgi:hypothetical protein
MLAPPLIKSLGRPSLHTLNTYARRAHIINPIKERLSEMGVNLIGMSARPILAIFSDHYFDERDRAMRLNTRSVNMVGNIKVQNHQRFGAFCAYGGVQPLYVQTDTHSATGQSSG